MSQQSGDAKVPVGVLVSEASAPIAEATLGAVTFGKVQTVKKARFFWMSHGDDAAIKPGFKVPPWDAAKARGLGKLGVEEKLEEYRKKLNPSAPSRLGARFVCPDLRSYCGTQTRPNGKGIFEVEVTGKVFTTSAATWATLQEEMAEFARFRDRNGPGGPDDPEWAKYWSADERAQWRAHEKRVDEVATRYWKPARPYLAETIVDGTVVVVRRVPEAEARAGMGLSGSLVGEGVDGAFRAPSMILKDIHDGLESVMRAVDREARDGELTHERFYKMMEYWVYSHEDDFTQMWMNNKTPWEKDARKMLKKLHIHNVAKWDDETDKMILVPAPGKTAADTVSLAAWKDMQTVKGWIAEANAFWAVKTRGPAGVTIFNTMPPKVNREHVEVAAQVVADAAKMMARAGVTNLLTGRNLFLGDNRAPAKDVGGDNRSDGWYAIHQHRLSGTKIPFHASEGDIGLASADEWFAHPRQPGEMLATFVHELGHAFWYERMKEPGRRRYLDFVYRYASPGRVTDYAKTNGAEDFAETWSWYFTRKQSKRFKGGADAADARERFLALLRDPTHAAGFEPVPESVTEVFDSPAPWRWIKRGPVPAKQKHDEHVAAFEIEGRRYEVTFTLVSSPEFSLWVVVFSVVKSSGGGEDGTGEVRRVDVTGDGAAPRVLGTVLAIVRAFVKEMDPRALSFSASEDSRRRLYAAMAKRFAHDLGFKVRQWGGSFKLTRERAPVAAEGVLVAESPINFSSVNLKAKYDEFNQKYFDGALPKDVKLDARPLKGKTAVMNAKWMHKGSMRGALAQLTQQDAAYDFRITFNTAVAYDDSMFDGILLHEMIHVWFAATGWPLENHGSKFIEKAREIGRKAGVEVPLSHDYKETDTLNVPEREIGVFIVTKDARNPDDLFLFFDPKALDAFQERAEAYAFMFRRPIKLYRANTKAWTLSPVKRKPDTRGIQLSKLVGIVAANLDLGKAKLVATVFPPAGPGQDSKVVREAFAEVREDESIEETLTSPYPYTIRSQTFRDQPSWAVTWSAHGKKCDMDVTALSKNGDGRYATGFAVCGKMGVTGEGDAFRIFSTVAAALRDVLKRGEGIIRSLDFSALEPSRARLYHRLARKLAQEFGMVVTHLVDDDDGETKFTLKRTAMPAALAATVEALRKRAGPDGMVDLLEAGASDTRSLSAQFADGFMAAWDALDEAPATLKRPPTKKPKVDAKALVGKQLRNVEPKKLLAALTRGLHIASDSYDKEWMLTPTLSRDWAADNFGGDPEESDWRITTFNRQGRGGKGAPIRPTGHGIYTLKMALRYLYDYANQKMRFGVDDRQTFPDFRIVAVENVEERLAQVLTEAALDDLPPVKPGHVRLYRGTPTKHKVQSLSKADPYALFGPGIYLTSSKRIANDYTTKGAGEDVLFRYHGRTGTVSKAEVVKRFIEQTARYMDDQGRPSWKQSGLPRPYDNWHLQDDPGSKSRLKKAAALWKTMEKDHEVRVSADGTAVIRKKIDAKHDLGVYDVPKAWIDATINAEAEVDEDVLMAMYYALRDQYGGFAGEIVDHAHARDEDGFTPTFRQVYGLARMELGNVHEKFRRELKERGVKVKGVRYAGGVTIGGAGHHDAFAFWDEQGLAKLRVNESRGVAEEKEPPGNKRATKLIGITKKGAEKEAGEADRHQQALVKIRQDTANAQRDALMTTESMPTGVLLSRPER